MDLIKADELAEKPAPSAYFTGEVWQIPLGAPPAPARVKEQVAYWKAAFK